MPAHLVKITNDVFDIAARLKEVDADYFVMYNIDKRRFEVHSRRLPEGMYAALPPFDRLDSRTVDYVRETRAERKDEILKLIEKSDRAEAMRDLKLADEAKYKAKQLIAHLECGGTEMPEYGRL